MQLQTLTLAAFLGGGLLLTAAREPAERSAAGVDELFPAPSRGLVIPADDTEGEGEANLLDLLGEFGRATGHTLVVTDEVRGLLSRVRPGLLSQVSVPPERVYSFVEGLLSFHEFVLVPLHESEPRLLGVQSLSGGSARNTIKQRCFYVPPDEIEAWADHPAVLVSTVVTFEHLDVRQLTTSLRPLMPDQSTQSMLNAGSSNSVVLQGFGAGIARLVHMLRIVDAEAGRAAERAAAEAPPAAGGDR